MYAHTHARTHAFIAHHRITNTYVSPFALTRTRAFGPLLTFYTANYIIFDCFPISSALKLIFRIYSHINLMRCRHIKLILCAYMSVCSIYFFLNIFLFLIGNIIYECISVLRYHYHRHRHCQNRQFTNMYLKMDQTNDVNFKHAPPPWRFLLSSLLTLSDEVFDSSTALAVPLLLVRYFLVLGRFSMFD